MMNESRFDEKNIVREYLKVNFPLVRNKSIHSPFELGFFLSRYLVTNIDGVRLSKFKIIKSLIDDKLIPVEKTTAYKVQTYVSLGLIPVDCSWTDLSTHGRKSLLTSHELMWRKCKKREIAFGTIAVSRENS